MKFTYNINKINKYIGETISWLTLLMVLVTVAVLFLPVKKIISVS